MSSFIIYLYTTKINFCFELCFTVLVNELRWNISCYKGILCINYFQIGIKCPRGLYAYAWFYVVSLCATILWQRSVCCLVCIGLSQDISFGARRLNRYCATDPESPFYLRPARHPLSGWTSHKNRGCRNDFFSSEPWRENGLTCIFNSNYKINCILFRSSPTSRHWIWTWWGT